MVVLPRPGRSTTPRSVAFLAGFGELTFTAGETPVDGFPDLNVISNVGRTTPPRSIFHVDTSYVASRRPTPRCARSRIPEQGGRDALQQPVPRLRHAARRHARPTRGPHDPARRHRPRARRPASETEADHPVFRPHPVSGRTALYLSTPERCAAISGLDDDEAAETDRASCYAHSTADDNVYRHAWSPGDVVMWDNGCVLHRADHAGVVGDRVMHRGMVAPAYAAVAGRRRIVPGDRRTAGALARCAGAAAAGQRSPLDRRRDWCRRPACRGRPRPRRPAGRRRAPRTVLISGGKMTKALQLARAVPRRRAPGRAGRAGELPAHRAPLLPGGRRASTPCPTRRTPATPQALLRHRRAPRASTSTCRSAARSASYYDALAEPSCWPRTARCCTPTPRLVAHARRQGRASPTLAASLGPGRARRRTGSPTRSRSPTSTSPRVRPDPTCSRASPTTRSTGSTSPRCRCPPPRQTAAFARSKPISRGQPLDPPGVRRRPGVLHAQHRPRRPGAGLVLLRVVGLPGQLRAWSTSPRSRTG